MANDIAGVVLTPKQDQGFRKGYLFGIAFISALGGYLFGFDFAVISGALPFLEKQFGLNAYWEGFATGSLALGAIAGCLLAGWMSDRYGRRSGLLVAAIVFAISSLAMAFSLSRNVFVCSRFCAGIGVGMASVLSPMYIAEIAPASLRGRLVAINQLTIVIGILVTNIVNYQLRNIGDNAWRWMFGFGMVPSALFFIGALWLPESPRWLIKKRRYAKAEAVVRKFGSEAYAQSSLRDITRSLENVSTTSFREVFSRAVLPTVVVGIGLAAFQQLCGINTVFNYSAKIFESIGASQDDQLLQIVFIGGVNLFFTVVAMLLVDKLGRRPLMLIGAAGLAICYIVIVQLLALKSAAVSCFLLGAIGLYAMSLAPVTWVLIAEIFPTKVRGEATSVATVCLWLAYFILVFSFPPLFEKIHENAFYIYAGICVAGFVCVWLKVKETKGKTLEDLETMMIGH